MSDQISANNPRISLFKFVPTIVLSALVSLCFVMGTLGQEVYRVVDEKGNITYTDSPTDKSAEKVEIHEPIIVPGTTPRPARDRNTGDGIPTKYQVTITSPTDESHLNPGEWDLSISVSTEPGVHDSHNLQILDNGEVVSSEGGSTTISNIVRGTHSLQARVTDKRGRVLGASETVTVYVHRPTVRN